jgi:hypothetical protein
MLRDAEFDIKRDGFYSTAHGTGGQIARIVDAPYQVL